MNKVYLIGAGPGDAQLITVKGLSLLRRCDVVLYDKLASNELLAQIPAHAIAVDVGKRAGHHALKQEEINELLVSYAKQYACVVRLKGGDPFVFGRAVEEMEVLLENGIEYEVIPGISSCIAAAEAAGIPVTARGISTGFYVMTGHTKDSMNSLPKELAVAAQVNDTLVFLMGLGNLDEIARQLIMGGKSAQTPVAVVSEGTGQNQKRVNGTLETIAHYVKQENITAPAVIVVGDVAALDYRTQADKHKKRMKLGIACTQHMAEKIENICPDSMQLFKLSTLQIQKAQNTQKIRECLLNVSNITWILFTSQNAITLFFAMLRENKIDLRILSNVRFAVVGQATSSVLQEFGFFADFVPGQANFTSLVTELLPQMDESDQILIPCGTNSSSEPLKILDDRQIAYQRLLLYDCVVRPEPDFDLANQMDCLIFTSRAGVIEFFHELEGHGSMYLDHPRIGCIGKNTAQAFIEVCPTAQIIAIATDALDLMKQIEQWMENHEE